MLRIEPENILLGALAGSKEQAIREVAGLLVRSGFIEPGYADSMLARERVANTYLGQGIAIPHGLPKDRELIRRTGIAVLQVPSGVSWQPGDTAHLVVGIAAKSDEHLDVLGKLTDLLADRELVDRLAVTRDVRDVIAALSAERADGAPPAEHTADFAQSVEATVSGAHGLHARPATAFVELAKGFDAEVLVRHGGKTADGRSLAGLLKLGVKTNGRCGSRRRGPTPEPRSGRCSG
jgi:phosphocarrier protein FPr